MPTAFGLHGTHYYSAGLQPAQTEGHIQMSNQRFSSEYDVAIHAKRRMQKPNKRRLVKELVARRGRLRRLVVQAMVSGTAVAAIATVAFSDYALYL